MDHHKKYASIHNKLSIKQWMIKQTIRMHVYTSCWDSYKDYTYVGTLDGLYQHTLIATGTRLRPVEAASLRHMLGNKSAKNVRVEAV